MNYNEFDYYIFIDYSENFLGYMIIGKDNVRKFLTKISKFSHYNEVKHKRSYLKSIKKVIAKEKVASLISGLKIKGVRATPEIYSDVFNFLNVHNNFLIFISVDDKQYSNFERLVKIIDGKKMKVVRESEMKKGTEVHQMSLVLDTFLNIERLK